ncbi:hypothetical protein PSHT_03018 [Puccinia striiformis]|uniref:protein-tyrosine-phosphatase n=2 Tax=Puccinia striiformis TaxID=27350 RepID=A0A2S4WGJ9_9BASI|nr:hypothetical protein PSTT_04918 [Puccinia striiformis]POW20894.1 hypothetical protein PSHT_03018 [Puccinia striiformis]
MTVGAAKRLSLLGIRNSTKRSSSGSAIISPKDLIQLEPPSTPTTELHSPTATNNNNNQQCIRRRNSTKPQPITAEQLILRLFSTDQQPLLILDLRTQNSYLAGRLKGSINLNFPSLLIKRFRRGTPTNFKLNPFITTEAGKRYYTKLETTYPSVLSQLDICVIDDQLLSSTQPSSIGKIFLDLLSDRQRTSGLYFLSEPFEALTDQPSAQEFLLLADPKPSTATATPIQNTTTGLLRLHPSLTITSLPSIDPESATSTTKPSASSSLPDPAVKTKPPKLRRIDTSEQSLSAAPARSSASSSKHSLSNLKIDHLNIHGSPHTPSPLHQLPSDNKLHVTFSDPADGGSIKSATNTYDRSPCTKSPKPQSLAEHQSFKVSTIIPQFLYLGPEPSKPSDFQVLEKLGIKRILNTALECDYLQNHQNPNQDQNNSVLDQYPFLSKYYKIPLRDFVEEIGVQNGIEEANRILNDAFLHSSPIYVHCKAGKSRSVTIVLAFLIHRYRWTLKKSYAHVSERRQGICPNIGFLAELMNFEQREIGTNGGDHAQNNKYKSGGGSGGGMVGRMHTKNARSVSHHYSSSMIVPSNSHTGGGFSIPTTSSSISPSHDHHHLEQDDHDLHLSKVGSGLAGYRIDGHSIPNKPSTFDNTRHHGFRVRSLIVTTKNDFFNSLTSANSSTTTTSTAATTTDQTTKIDHSISPTLIIKDPSSGHITESPILVDHLISPSCPQTSR